MAPAVTAKPKTDAMRRLQTCLLILIAAAAVRFWCMPLESSLWLDETGTYWTVKDGLGTAMARVFDAQTTSSPIHIALEWAFLKLPGPIEVRLRMVSVIAILLSILLLYRLGRRLLGPEAALISISVFTSIGSVIFAGTDARPYALWLLAAIASTLALVEWMETGGRVAMSAFVLLASLSIYIHYLAFLMFFVYGAYALVRIGQWSPVRPKELVWAAVVIAVAALPVLPVLLRLHSESRLHYYLAKAPHVFDLEVALAPPNLIAGILGGLLVARLLFSQIEFEAPAAPRSLWVLLVAWSTAPVVVLFGISLISDAKLFHPRYLICAAPGTALLAALALRCIRPAAARIAMAASVLVAALLTYGSVRHLDIRHQAGEDWKDAAQTVALYADAATPVLVQSGFPESKWMNWLAAGARQDQMFAPLSVYPLAGTVIPLPMTTDSVSRGYLRSVISQKLAGSQRFLLVTYGVGDRF
jgi:mannosyltransferase